MIMFYNTNFDNPFLIKKDLHLFIMKKILFILLCSSFGFAQTIDVGLGGDTSGWYNSLSSRKLYKNFGAFASMVRDQEIKSFSIGINTDITENNTISFGFGSQKVKRGTITTKTIESYGTSTSTRPVYDYAPSYEFSYEYRLKLLAKNNAVGLKLGGGTTFTSFQENHLFVGILYSYDLGTK